MQAMMTQSRELMRQAMAQAARLDHRMPGMQPDVTDEGYLAECSRCGRYVAVDEGEMNGGTLRGRCTGRMLG
jgi:heme oxygenase